MFEIGEEIRAYRSALNMNVNWHSFPVLLFFLTAYIDATAASDEAEKHWLEVSDKFSKPLELCHGNFKDMKSFMLATTRLYGNEPSQADIDEMDDLYWCDCLYKTFALRTKELDLQSAVADSMAIEQFARKYSLLKGGKAEDWEREWFIHSLKNGESIMDTYALSLSTCQQ